MYKTVVLFGFSTTGKSTLLQYFKNHYRRKVIFIDTDKEVAKDYECHIYNIYLDLIEENDLIKRNKPIEYIKQAESALLKRLCEPWGQPRLIAAGPFINDKDNFDLFKKISKPEFYFFKIDAESVYDGLLFRHNQHIKEGLSSDPFFGCWDHGVTKAYNPESKYYELLPKEIALEKIRESLDRQQIKYAELAGFNVYNALDYRKDSKFFNALKLSELVDKIKLSLQL